MSRAIIQSNLKSILKERGLTISELYQRFEKQGEKIEQRSLYALRELSASSSTLNLGVLTQVMVELDYDITDILSVVREEDKAFLRSLVEYRFPEEKQLRMDELFYKATEGELTPEESVELHELVREFEDGTIKKAQAMKTLVALSQRRYKGKLSCYAKTNPKHPKTTNLKTGAS